MNTSTLSSLLFTLSLTLLLSHHSSTASNLYESVCQDAGEDSARCLQILRADPKIVAAGNYVELSKQILKMALKKGIEGQKYLKEVMSSSSSEAIEQCATTLYDGVVGSFQSSLGELKEDGLTANYDAKVAGDGPTTCERALAAENINNPSIATLNSDILLLSKIAFLATNQLPE